MKFLGIAKVVATTSSRFTKPIIVNGDSYSIAHAKLWDHINENQEDDARVLELHMLSLTWLDAQIEEIKRILKTKKPNKK